MICDTCERQSHCLTHQLADQDQRLHQMLEQLQGCQRRQATPARLPQTDLLQRVAQVMGKLSRRVA